MKMSRRALRMERHHKRSRAGAGLNLVSMMDIFTILVFFLLVQSSDVEVLPSAKSVRLPESIAEKSPKQTVVVTVNDQDILVQGRKIASVPEVVNGEGDTIDALKTELEYQARRAPLAAGKTQRDITILGDKEIPYRLLKKIMITCVRASYENISLAVLKKEAGG
jgi:biopolymer transport protein TolR